GRGMGRDGRGRALAAHQVRPAHDRGGALGRERIHARRASVRLVNPLADFPVADRVKVRGVLADIDDTLTTHGRLFAASYGALERLQHAGLLVIPVTGRS